MAADILTAADMFTPADLLLFRAYRREEEGSVEAALTNNPGLAFDGPYLGLGRQVSFEPTGIKDVAAPVRVIRLWD